MSVIYAILIFVILASLVVIGTILNNRTPKPEGCENLDGQCSGCKVTSCIKNPILKEEIKK